MADRYLAKCGNAYTICTADALDRARVMNENTGQTFPLHAEDGASWRRAPHAAPAGSWHVYGSRAALCIEPDRTRGGVETVAIEGALATAPRRYDWAGKIRVQITAQELPLFAAALLGYQDNFEAANHGDQGKGLTLRRQPERGVVFVRVVARGVEPRAVPVQAGDLYHLTAVVIGQLVLNHPALPYPAVRDILKSVGRLRSPVEGPA